MSLSSSSTLTTAIAQYNDNLAYWETPTKAQNLLEAVIWLMGNRPMYSSDAGTSFNFDDLSKLRKKLEGIVESSATSVARPRFIRTRLP